MAHIEYVGIPSRLSITREDRRHDGCPRCTRLRNGSWIGYGDRSESADPSGKAASSIRVFDNDGRVIHDWHIR